MTATVTALDFAPLLPWSAIAALAGLALLATFAGGAMRLSGWIWRTLAILGIALVLANPSLVEEERDPLADVAILVTDSSASMDIGGRHAASDAMAETLRREQREKQRAARMHYRGRRRHSDSILAA